MAPYLDPAVELRELDRLLALHEQQVTAAPGAGALLASCDSACWAVVGSGARALSLARFDRLGLPVPRRSVFGEDVQRGRPDPEGYLRACELLVVAPSNCVVVEDAPADVSAARAAGCFVLGVATTHVPSALTEAHETHVRLQSVTERLAALLIGPGKRIE